MPLQGKLSAEHMCQLVAVSRRGFYLSLAKIQNTFEMNSMRTGP